MRESISARLDGEAPPLDDAVVAAHVADCGDCAAFAVAAERLHRRVRVSSAQALPDLTERVTAAVANDAAIRRRLWRQWQGTRALLAVVALVEVVMAVPVLLLGHDAAAPVHVAHELGSFDLAIAIGMLLAAYRPRLASGMVPIVAIIALLLLLTAGSDVALGRTQLSDEMPHLLDVGGFLLLWRLAKVSGGSGDDDAGWAAPPGVQPEEPPGALAADDARTGHGIDGQRVVNL
ncbi:MAG: zf-HC2 domain-containing protein [Frankiaceae bacterium]|nr:zf-HC2 domain-containing protein [Frankiaceae bacterium]